MTRLFSLLLSTALVVYVMTDPPVDGNCEHTTFGCCSDGTTAKDVERSNCVMVGGVMVGGGLLGGCSGTEFGCCKDGSYAFDLAKSNCPENSAKRRFQILHLNSTNVTYTDSSNQSPLDFSAKILITLIVVTFLFVFLCVILLITSAVVIIVYRSVQRRRVRRVRKKLECELEVEMGDPLMVEEFGVTLPTVNS